MKKHGFMVFCALILLFVTACGNSQTANNSNQTSPTTSPTASPTASPTNVSPTETPVAEKWPTKELKIIIPFKAGAGLDVGIRQLAQYWQKHLGVNLVIENRDGANSQVGVTYFLNTKDEDSSIIASAQPWLSSTILLQDAKYSIDDIAIMNYHETDNSVIVVNESSPYQSMEELNAAIQAKPGQLRFGVSSGSSAAIMADLLKDHYGWNVKTVLYDGGTALRTALLGDHVDFMASVAKGSIDSGTDRILAISADERFHLIPDVPTLKELIGDDAPFLATFRYIGVKASMKEKYPARYQILLDTLKATYDDPEYQKALADGGISDYVSWTGPENSTRLHKELHELAVKYKDSLAATAK